MNGALLGIVGFLRRFKISNRIVGFFLLCLFLSLLLGIFLSSQITYKLTESYIYDYVESAQGQVVTGVESILDEMIMTTLRIKNNWDFYSVFLDGSQGYDEKRAAARSGFSTLLSDSDKTYIGAIYVVDQAGDVYDVYGSLGSPSAPDSLYLAALYDNQRPSNTVVTDEQGRGYILYSTRFYNFYTGQNIGHLVLYIRESVIRSVYEEIIPDLGYSFALSGNRLFLSHPDGLLLGTQADSLALYSSEEAFAVKAGAVDGSKSILAEHRLSQRMIQLGFDWKIVSVMPYRQLFGVVPHIRRSIVLVEVGMLLLALFPTLFISRRLTASLSALRNKVNDFGKKSLDVFIQPRANDEIAELETSFHEMVVRIHDLIEKNNEEKERQREMELLALQAQINPHFLYNTLDTIGWIAKIKQQDDIEALVQQLARFFRLSLHKGDKFIRVEEEIQLVQSFVFIQQMLRPYTFDIEYDVPESIRSQRMLKLVLQPLVENAIRHGVEGLRRKGYITVRAWWEEGDICIEVADDGAGFDTALVDFREVRNEIGRRSGYGLFNVDERIRIEYGPRYGLVIRSKPGAGTRAMVRFSKRDEEALPAASSAL